MQRNDGSQRARARGTEAEVDRDALAEIFASFDGNADGFMGQLTSACSRAIGVASCGVTLILEGEHCGSLGASSRAATRGEDLQAVLGEGPAYDAVRQGELVSEPHLALARHGRWPAFAPAATAVGIRAAFATPLSIGAATLGALTVYEPHRVDLTADQANDLVSVGGIVSGLVLSLQAGADAGTLASELASASAYHPEIHQATGMVAARLGVPVSEAMVLLRARAYADDVPLADLARDVVARRTHLDPP